MQSPNAPLPARSNPFRTERLHALSFRFDAGWTWARLLSSLKENGWRGEIVGGHGSGKTTLLRQLAQRLEEVGFSTQSRALNDQSKKADKVRLVSEMEAAPTASIWLVDGAERLGRLEWRRVQNAARHHRGLVITAHRSGRMPLLYKCRTTPLLLASLATELLESFVVAPWDIDALFERSHGDVRECLRALYDRMAE